MKKKKFYISIILLAALSIILWGCSGGTSEPSDSTSDDTSQNESGEKILQMAIPGEAEKLDAHWSNTEAEMSVIFPIYSGLVRFAPGTVDMEQIEPDLAESWESNEDSTVWTFYLREGVQWHRGYGEVTAEDVKWSFERVMDPETGSPWQSDYTNVESVETDGDYTVIFHLKQPDSAFLMKVLNYHGGNIVNKEAIEEAGENHMNVAIGTGPYMLEEYRTQDKVILVKNPDYFRGEPKLDGIEFNMMDDTTAIEVALENGELHMGKGVGDKNWIDRMMDHDQITIDMPEPRLFWGIYLNTSREPFNDKRVREAVNYAINQTEYVEEYLGTHAANVPTSPLASGYFGSAEADIIGYDPDKAKELLAEAGYADGLTLPTQYVTTNPTYLEKMIWVQDELRKVGIEMPIEQVDHATYHANVRENLNDMVLYAYVRQPHLDVPLTQFFYGPSIVGKETAVTNFIHYDKVDDLIEEARVATDLNEQQQLYEEIIKQINEDVVLVPFSESSTPYMRRNEVETGYVNGTEGGFGTMIYNYTVNENTDITN